MNVSFRDKVYRIMTIQRAEQLLSKITVCEHGHDCALCCWTWQGLKNRSGYGRFGTTVAKRTYYWYSHRLIYLFTYGEVPSRLYVCHHCDNPPCCNPAHLWTGTTTDNIHDALRKGRIARGERHSSRTHREDRPRGETHSSAKLKDHEVYQIRALEGHLSRAAIGRQFHISASMVRYIQQRRNWKHLPDRATDM